MFEQQLVNGLTLGLVYALIAVGCAMVCGVIELINFAHGEISMPGGLGNANGAIVGAVIPISLGEASRTLPPRFGLPTEPRFLAHGLIMILVMRLKFSGALPRMAGDSCRLGGGLVRKLRPGLDAGKAG